MAKITASVLAFEKKLVTSDGFFYGTNWDERATDKAISLKLIEKSVRGTISNRLKGKDKIEQANLQKVDACALGENQDTLRLGFTLKVLGEIERPSACNCDKFKESYVKAVRNYIETEGFSELAKRYAINIANARFLWRNRVGAESVEVVVRSGQDKRWVFDSKKYSLHDFNDNDLQINELATEIAKALSGKSDYFLLEIEAFAKVGKGQEVYPSEELVFDKGKEDKSKVLYSVNDVAAMHSQKIGNALRTIDTWYPEYEDAAMGPIAIEIYGSVTNLGKAYRTPKNKVDFYSLFDRFAMGEKLADKNEEHYVMAVLIRGGIFGQSSKE